MRLKDVVRANAEKENERLAQQQEALEESRKNGQRKTEALAAISKYRHLLYKVTKWGPNGSANGKPLPDDRHLEMDIDQANLITSALADQPGMHTIMLDLDVPAKLVSSSTPGHSHLYIDVKLAWDQYRTFLEACATANVIQRGYLEISKRHMSTSLRLPWIKKEK